jgi:alpha-glucosidase
MPWDEDAPQLGFTTGAPWLPLGAAHKSLAVSRQDGDRSSTLNFARDFLKKRKASAALRLGAIEALDAPAPILSFARTHGDERVVCTFNMSNREVEHNGRTLAPYGFEIG